MYTSQQLKPMDSSFSPRRARAAGPHEGDVAASHVATRVRKDDDLACIPLLFSITISRTRNSSLDGQ